jgi:hypothetical protein
LSSERTDSTRLDLFNRSPLYYRVSIDKSGRVVVAHSGFRAEGYHRNLRAAIDAALEKK